MQGEYKAEYKLADDWELLLEDAKAGKLQDSLQQNTSFQGSALPTLFDNGGAIALSVLFPAVRNSTAARLHGTGAVPGFAPAEAAVADWSAEARRRFGTAVTLHPEGRTILVVDAKLHVLQVKSTYSGSWVPDLQNLHTIMNSAIFCGREIAFSS